VYANRLPRGWARLESKAAVRCRAEQSRAELEQTAQDQEPAIRTKVEKKGPRRVSEGEGAKGRERKGREGKGTKVSRYEGVR